MATWQVYTLLGLVLAILIGLPFIAGRLRELQLSEAGLGHLKEWSDEDMLRHMARILGAMGYRVHRAGEEHPQFDLLLTDGLGQRRAVLVRHWRQVIDADVVTAFTEAAAELGKAPGMIVTVERYTLKAREAAKASEAILWEISDLARAIGQIKRTSMAFPDLPAVPAVVNPPFTMEVLATAQQPTEPATPVQPQPEGKVLMKARRRPTRLRKGDRFAGDGVPFCPRCGKKMAERTNPNGTTYWACPSFPRCLGSRSK